MSASLPDRRGAASTHQAAMPEVPGPDELPSEEEMQGPSSSPQMPEPMRTYYERERPIEMRPVEIERYLSREPMRAALPCLDPGHRAPAGRSGDPPRRARLCVRHDAPRHLAHPPRPHGVRARRSRPASLDHALWFHRPSAPTNGCFTRRTPRAPRGARGFSRGLDLQAGRDPGRLRCPGRPHPRPRRLRPDLPTV